MEFQPKFEFLFVKKIFKWKKKFEKLSVQNNSIFLKDGLYSFLAFFEGFEQIFQIFQKKCLSKLQNLIEVKLRMKIRSLGKIMTVKIERGRCT